MAEDFTLDDYQRIAHRTAGKHDIDLFALGLTGESGSVASALKKLARDHAGFELVKSEVAEELGDTLWYLAEIASHLDLSLSEIAKQNLEKATDLFGDDGTDFEEGYPEGERFPRQIAFKIDDSSGVARIFHNDRPFGDPLDDNAWIEDGYRFHDVFHLSYMVHLQWSPVVRRNLKLKRRSNAETDRVEDGARARFLEEGIAALVFGSCPNDGSVSLFSDRQYVPLRLIGYIKKMVQPFEVRHRNAISWSHAICDGFRIFDDLCRNGGGVITCDLDQKMITVSR
jgi:NTP pyrophosphatase (non-canonical NTP hydrolase)